MPNPNEAPEQPLTEGQREILDKMAERKPPYPFCHHPDKCIATGRCERRLGGELWCCAD